MTSSDPMPPDNDMALLPGVAIFSDTARHALDQLDAATFQWARRVQRGEFARRMIRRLQIDLELAEFQGLGAVFRLRHGTGGAAPRAASVGNLAEELAIDPSRASRIAGDLVRKGFVRRRAAQGDGRKSLLELSDAGMAVMKMVKQAKSETTARTFAAWAERDIVAFAGFFTRFAAEGLTLPDTDAGAAQGRDAIARALRDELDRRGI